MEPVEEEVELVVVDDAEEPEAEDLRLLQLVAMQMTESKKMRFFNIFSTFKILAQGQK
jgi:hypothetical protein